MKQMKLFKAESKSHGGGISRGKRKGPRPVTTKSPMHITFKSTRAKGDWNLLRKGRTIRDQAEETAERFGVRLLRFVNVGNHLHLAVQGRSRRDIQNFLRVFPQRVMFLVTGAKKGNAVGRFWDDLVHTRVVSWGRDWRNFCSYLFRNQLESEGTPRVVVEGWRKDYLNGVFD